MTRINHSRIILSAVLAALPIFGLASSAHGQFQVGSGGHANDANNRVGSGGVNTTNGNGSTNGYSNNTNVFTGNVSGLNYFHGSTNGIFDSNTVQANTESAATDRINQVSAPSSGGYQGPQAYYNASRTITPPAGFSQTLNGAAYMPSPQYNPLTPNADSRLGGVNLNNQPQNLLPQPGEIDMVGQVDPTGSQSLFTMSPLYGVRKNDSTDAGDSFFVSQYSNYGHTGAGDRSRMQAANLRRMQDELNDSALPVDQQNPGDNNTNNPNGTGVGNGATNNGGGNNGAINNGAANTGALNTGALNNGALQGGALAPGQLPNQALTSTLGSTQIDNSLSNGQGTQNRLLIPASRQSAQIQALEKKFANQKLNDAQASDLFNQQQRILRAADKNAAKPTDGKPGLGLGSTTAVKPSPDTFSGTGDAVAPGTPGNTVAAPPKPEAVTPVLPDHNNAATDNQPFVITSLATGIKAKGLSDMLKSAESQMRDGKFSQAIDTYDSAQQVASNNPFIPLGRGFAELGRSYYAKADGDIARAVAAEPAVLAGQYDLKGFIGDARVRFIQKDLQDISATEKSARSSVLLAFIAHNTGDDASAATLLDDAAARGGYDSMVKQMREAWNLKAAAPAAK